MFLNTTLKIFISVGLQAFHRLLLLFLCLVFTFLKCERHCDSVLGSLVFTCYIISHYQCALLLTQL